jgi:hypothetical protein
MIRRNPILTGLLLTALALGGTGWFASRVMGQGITCNILRFVGGIAGADPQVAASGCDTNVNINLVPKGTGVVKIGGVALVPGGATIGSAVTGGTSPLALFIKPGPVLGQDPGFTYDPVGFTASIIPNTTFGLGITATAVKLGTQATPELTVTAGLLTADIAAARAWATDLFLTRAAAAVLHLGKADVAAPVAQTLGVQGVVTGTANTAGAAFTVAGSQGTGTGLGGDVIVSVSTAGGAGSTQNPLVEAVRVTSALKVIMQDLKTTGAATGKKSVCVDTATGQLYASSAANNCAN